MEGLNNIFREFDSLYVCQGVTDPTLLSIPSNPNGIKKEKLWRAKACSLFSYCKKKSGAAICTHCQKLTRSLKNGVTVTEREALRKNKLTAARKKIQNCRDIIARKVAQIEVRTFVS